MAEVVTEFQKVSQRECYDHLVLICALMLWVEIRRDLERGNQRFARAFIPHSALMILSDISSSFSTQITKSDIIEMIARETSGTYKDCLQAAG